MIREQSSQHRGVVLDGPVSQDDSKFIEWLVQSGCSLSGRDSASTGALAKVVRVDFGFSKEEAELLADVPSEAQYVAGQPAKRPVKRPVKRRVADRADAPQRNSKPATNKTATQTVPPEEVSSPQSAPGQHVEGDPQWQRPQGNYARNARGYLNCMKAIGKPVLYGEGLGWHIYSRTHYVHHTDEEFERELYHFFSRRSYPVHNKKEGKTTLVDFDADGAFLRNARQATRAPAHWPKLVHNSWLDGRKDHVIPFRNGLFDLGTRHFTEGHTPNYFSTYCLSFDYDPRVLCPRWRQFLDDVWPDDPDAQALLQEWFGYVISGRTNLHKMLVLVGVGRSGKGTLTDVLKQLIGGEDHCAAVTSASLANRFGNKQMVGKPLAVFADERLTVQGKFVVPNLLMLTGEDQVRIEGKGKDEYSARLPTRLMLCSNEVPTLPDASGTIVSRILKLYMGVSWLGREDRDLPSELTSELSGIFNWALAGLRRLEARGDRFTHAHSADEVLGTLQAGASPVREFVDEMCVVGPPLELAVAKATLYDVWRHWCEANGHHPGSSAELGKKLFAALGNGVRSGKVGARGDQRPAYRGIALRTDPDDFTEGIRRA